MNTSIYFRVAVMLATIGIVTLANKCDICQANNGIACHNENVFSVCVNGQPTYDMIECPPDYVCTATRFICVPQGQRGPAIAICQISTTVEPITSTEQPTTIVETTTTKDEPTTITTTTTTTESPCNRPSGSETYFVRNEDDPTCKTYIYCVRSQALLINCPTAKYFNAESETCVQEKPTYCI